MSRKLRLESWSHVLPDEPGDQREHIFRDDNDRQRFLSTLGEACGKTEWRVQENCLTRNHFHLVVETSNGNLVDRIRWRLSARTIRLNHRHKPFGHLFQWPLQGGDRRGQRQRCLNSNLRFGRARSFHQKLEPIKLRAHELEMKADRPPGTR